MSNISIEMNTDNAAFEAECRAEEVARILEKLAKKIRNGSEGETLRDINGNTVGNYDSYE